VTDSWWLKLDRAKDHLDEFKGVIDPLLKRCVNPVTKSWETYDHQPAFVYRVRFSNPEPDERLPVIAGDFMHNVRSALDHVAVALAPIARKHDASFPIFTCDIHEQDQVTGRYLHPSDRKKWLRRIEGMSEGAVAILDTVQPFHGGGTGQDPADSPLALLCEFQNADKHRELNIVAQGLTDPEFILTYPDGSSARDRPPVPLDGLMRNGAIVHVDRSNPPEKMEMDTEGTPRIVIGSSIDGPVRECPGAFDRMLTVACALAHDLSALI
jgi:hypothetical protein